MNKYETITGILGFFCLLSFGSGTGIIMLYNHGDAFSHVVVFLTLFGTSFFVSGFQNHTSIDTFIKDIFIGTAAILLSGLVLLLGSYESMAIAAPISIYTIVIIKMTGNRKRM